MYKFIFFYLLLCLLTVGCATNQSPVEESYLGSKTTFENIFTIKGTTLESAKKLILELLNQHNFSVVKNDSIQNILVAKKQVNSTNTFITSSIYFFKNSNDTKIRVKSNTPIDYFGTNGFHADLLKIISEN